MIKHEILHNYLGNYLLVLDISYLYPPMHLCYLRTHVASNGGIPTLNSNGAGFISFGYVPSTNDHSYSTLKVN